MKLRSGSAAEMIYLGCLSPAMLLSMSAKSKFGLFEILSHKSVNLLNYSHSLKKIKDRYLFFQSFIDRHDLISILTLSLLKFNN